MSLDLLERQARKQLLRHAPQVAAINPLHAMIGTFIVTPLAVTAFLFIPFFGQLLAIGSLLVSLVYLRITRSWRCLLAGLGGGGASIGSLALASYAFNTQGELMLYFLLAFSVAINIAYIVIVAGLIWSHLEKARAALAKSA
ncbi:MAG: hypothetical protein DCC75_13640 [Proteobacteria bacterium]|nr:MAG: hypothetical protein DCC75_13640 [Pseudomonadota bacterium]